MKDTGEWGRFFPGRFSPVPYNESWSAVHFPLSADEQEELGFSLSHPRQVDRPAKAEDSKAIPDSPNTGDEALQTRVFWDAMAKRPLRISAADLQFAKKMSTPLNNVFYASRLKENFCWMQYDGTLRDTTCAKSRSAIQTSWPPVYDGRIVSEDEYLKIVA